MLTDFDFPVIETYTQLAWLITAFFASLLVAKMLVRSVRRPLTARLRQRASLTTTATPVSGETVPRSGLGPQHSVDFDKLASLISNGSQRAGAIAQFQSAAAVKLDSSEIAINRLMSDLASIMVVPRGRAAIGSASALLSPRVPVLKTSTPLPAVSTLAV